MREPQVTLRPLTRYNWETAVGLKLHDYQEDFLPPVLHTIAQSKFEEVHLFGIFEADLMVGFLAYGEFGGICWINRVLVDKHYQQMGIGKLALRLLLEKLKKNPVCQEIRTSFTKQNAIAEYFFRSEGFQRIADGLDDEIVMTYVGI